MKTLLLDDSRESLEIAGKILSEGGLVAFPTETVYGLGADALKRESVAKIYSAKGRPSDNPMIVHIADSTELESIAYEITDDMKILIKEFWPGPLTMIVKSKEIVPDITRGGLDTVGVRLPENSIARQIIEFAKTPIAAPSANISGKPSPTKAKYVVEDMNGKIDAIIQGEDCQLGIESTVIDMTNEIPMILRPGMITKEAIEKSLNKKIDVDPYINSTGTKESRTQIDNDTCDDLLIEDGPKSPGMKYKHYAPKGEMILYRGESEEVENMMKIHSEKYIEEGKKVRILPLNKMTEKDIAAKFFDMLREADNDKVDIILAPTLKEEGVGFSIMNRMLRSAGFTVLDVAKENKMIIAMAADHGGYELKNQIKEYVESKGDYEVLDLGTNSSESVDYPLYGRACGEAVADGKADIGMVFCGTGIGISIAANKVKGIRCALVTSTEMARLTKEHNNANILAMGGRTTTLEDAKAMTDAWLESSFEGGRHQKRIDLIEG